jgi:hypothetical protein
MHATATETTPAMESTAATETTPAMESTAATETTPTMATATAATATCHGGRCNGDCRPKRGRGEAPEQFALHHHLTPCFELL